MLPVLAPVPMPPDVPLPSRRSALLLLSMSLALALALVMPLAMPLALAILHALTIYRVYPALLDPFFISEKGFPTNRNSVNALAIMAAMLALWLLRGRDTWSLDVFLRRRRG